MIRRSIAVLAAAIVLGACGDAADPADAALTVGPSEMRAEAERLLATDRPWRAALVMRRYLDETDEATLSDRILAARAEAGWGAWDRVLELAEDGDGFGAGDDATGLYLLARARDEQGDAEAAVTGYRRYLDALAGGGQAGDRDAGAGERGDTGADGASGDAALEADAARLRLGLALLRLGRRDDARSLLDRAGQVLGESAAWLPLLEAEALARAGDTAAVRETVDGVNDGLQGLHAWRARVAAAVEAGDHAQARRLADEAARWARTSGTTSEFRLAEGRAALAMGDTEAGRAALRRAVELDPGGPYAREAGPLLAEGDLTPADHLAVATVLVEQGLHEDAVPHFEAWLDADVGTADERREVRLDYADALYYSGEFDEVVRALRPLGDHRDAVSKRARALAYADEFDDAVELYMGRARANRGTGLGEQALYLAADTRHDEGDLEEAERLFRQHLSDYSRSGRRGLVMMRLAGIAFQQGRYDEAAETWDEYRRRYPSGSLAEQATYWAGRAHEELGDTAAARARWRQVKDDEPMSYYALVASERLGEAFWPIPMTSSPAVDPAAERTVAGWMRGLDLLEDAGFPDIAYAEADRVVQRAGSDRSVRYSLAEALAERGYAMRAIRLAIGLQTNGPPNPRLLRILYPFPYRTLITEEARERGFDPFVAAALIRQESLFEARITSHVGARGLMQMMPATGEEVAAGEGIERWDPEMLYLPEFNVHLGTALVGEYLERYEGSLPSVFGAYNAGEHRVEWWSEYAEYGNDQLFTERIPYGETRDYVKILTRNRALYEGLYGDRGAEESAP